jgi:hypothetical protein
VLRTWFQVFSNLQILQVRNINAPTFFACVLSIFGCKTDGQYIICMDSGVVMQKYTIICMCSVPCDIPGQVNVVKFSVLCHVNAIDFVI